MGEHMGEHMGEGMGEHVRIKESVIGAWVFADVLVDIPKIHGDGTGTGTGTGLVLGARSKEQGARSTVAGRRVASGQATPYCPLFCTYLWSSNNKDPDKYLPMW